VADGSAEAAPAPAATGAPAEEAGQGGSARRGRWELRWEIAAFLELLAVCGLAVAQPLLDITGRSPDFFLFTSADRIDFVLLLVGATLPLPLALWALGAATGVAGRRVRRVAHVVLLAALFAVLAVVVGKKLVPLRSLPLEALALVTGVALAVVYTRTQFLRQMLWLTSVGPALFVALFVLESPSGAVFLHKDARAVPVRAGASAARHPPIVMILFDEFPLTSLMDGKGGIDARRYPNFAALANRSTWYRNATAVSSFTPYAVPAMLTGRYPYKKVAPFYVEYPDNLFTLFGGVYDLKIQESVTLLCPPRSCPSNAQDEPVGGSVRAVLKGSAKLVEDIVSPSDSVDDPTAGFREPTDEERAAEQESTVRRSNLGTGFRFGAIRENQPARFTAFVDGLQPSATPTVHFLHVLLPHTPYRQLPLGMRYDPAPSKLTDRGAAAEKREWWLKLTRQRYEAQLAYTDALVGDAILALRRSRLYDDALVVVTADHGRNFTPGVYKRDYKGSTPDVLWVPLFIKAPGQRTGKVDDRNWEHADLFPTIADYAAITVPWRTDGISALRQRRDRQEKWFYPTPGHRVAVAGPSNLAKVLRGWDPLIPTLPELVGRRVDELPVSDGGPGARVKSLANFRNVQPASGTIPALVYGLVPLELPDDSRIAIAVNGRIGAVATTARDRADRRWFAGLIENERLFVRGANKLELFLVGQDGRSLRRLALEGADG
jgi:hypothetical protein